MEDEIENFDIFEIAENKTYNLLRLVLENLHLYNFEINLKNDNGDTLLHILTKDGAYNLCVTVIVLGSDVNQTNHKNETPLHNAFAAGYSNIIELLIENGAKTSHFSKGKESPLFYALRNGHLRLIKTFHRILPVEHNTLDENYTLLDIAIAESSLKKIIFLLDLNLFSLDALKLQQAVEMNVSSEVLQFLIQYCNWEEIVDIKDDKSRSLLHLATKNKNIDLVKVLIEFNCNVNVQDRNGETPLHYAVQTNSKDIVNLLLSKGANVNMIDQDDYTALHLAAVVEEKSEFDVDILQTLLKRKANAQIRTYNGETALHRAAVVGNIRAVVNLMKHTVYGNTERNLDGKTPLQLAEEEGRLDVVRFLKVLDSPNVKR